MKNLIVTLSLLFFSVCTFAEEQPFKQFGNTKVFYSAFNSSFIDPEIASIYKISRGEDKGLVNVAVIVGDRAGGQTAVVEGVVSNIFAQQQTLDFFEVREGDAVYYLAPFDFENEDFLTFTLKVRSESGGGPYDISFQRTFYHED